MEPACALESSTTSLLAGLVVFAFGTYLRKFDAENSVVSEGDGQKIPRCKVYINRRFIKGLLLASVTLSLSEHFNDVRSRIQQQTMAFAGLDLDKRGNLRPIRLGQVVLCHFSRLEASRVGRRRRSRLCLPSASQNLSSGEWPRRSEKGDVVARAGFSGRYCGLHNV